MITVTNPLMQSVTELLLVVYDVVCEFPKPFLNSKILETYILYILHFVAFVSTD